MKDIFTVEKAVVIKADGRESLCFFVLENGSPDFLVNNWLELKGAHSSLTARQYAYNLTRFLNYLKTIGEGYKNATKAGVLNFMSILLYGGEDNVYNLKANITINTGLVCLNTIKEFYRYLEDYTNQSLQMRLESRGPLYETIHNYIDIDERMMRKGAVPAKKDELLLIPMNMRDGSLLCKGKGNPDWNFSAPHGAGRRLSRNAAIASITLEQYEESMKGIFTTSVSPATIDEAPDAYKPMEEIVDIVRDAVQIVDVLKPIYNFKAAD